MKICIAKYSLRINQKSGIITNFSQGARVRHDYKNLLDEQQISRINHFDLARFLVRRIKGE